MIPALVLLGYGKIAPGRNEQRIQAGQAQIIA